MTLHHYLGDYYTIKLLYLSNVSLKTHKKLNSKQNHTNSVYLSLGQFSIPAKQRNSKHVLDLKDILTSTHRTIHKVMFKWNPWIFFDLCMDRTTSSEHVTLK